MASTKSALKKAIKKGFVRVNGELASTATMIKGSEEIVLISPDPSTKKISFKLELKVLFEDDYLAAINKPSGISVSGNSAKTIAQALDQNLKHSNQSDRCTAQPVHRLDFPTTGVLLIGKTVSSIRKLNQLFKNRSLRKIYSAIVIGSTPAEGEINLPIEGKPAKSHYHRLELLPSPHFGTLSLLQLRPESGKRHQLRKHLASIGHPILGDREYTPKGLEVRGKGLYLHAYSIEFLHPFSEQNLQIRASFPNKFFKIFPSLEDKMNP